MRNLLLFIFSAFTAIALKAQTPSIEALRTCAAEKGIPPKEYIFKLFEKSDIVVLGERDHRDTVQYDLIHDILADPRFAEQIGYVYTEVGSYNMNDDVNRLLQGCYPTEAAFMNDRDSLMATHISEMYARQTPLNGKRKALVITNQPPSCYKRFVYSQKEQYCLWSTGLVDEENLWRRTSQNRGSELV